MYATPRCLVQFTFETRVAQFAAGQNQLRLSRKIMRPLLTSPEAVCANCKDLNIETQLTSQLIFKPIAQGEKNGRYLCSDKCTP
jgi:hypothetical protein